MNFVSARQLLRELRDKNRIQSECYCERQCTARDCQQNTLRQKLSHYTTASCAQRREDKSTPGFPFPAFSFSQVRTAWEPGWIQVPMRPFGPMQRLITPLWEL